MDSEKFNAVLNYFSSSGIDVPVSVRNAIEDVFMENDDVQAVECYHAEDIDQFQKDLKLENEISMTLGAGHFGKINNVWTYYGSISYSYSEYINLLDSEGNVIEKVSEIISDDDSLVEEPEDWVISLIETVEWKQLDSEKSVKTILYIYCPEGSEEFEV